MNQSEQPWLVGAGRMAKAYVPVLKALGLEPRVVGRGEDSAKAFEAETGLSCRPGGLSASLEAAGAAPASAIVAIDIPELAAVARSLIEAGCRRILLEKPGGVDRAQIEELAMSAHDAGAEIFLAYNRRFYGSVRAAREALAEDGGPTSMSFDFTESADQIVKIGYPAEVLDNWLLANSTHVIDTAFFLAGEPVDWRPRVAGRLDWHPRAARFAGCGETERNVMFSYAADWDAPGRWSIEIASRKRRFVLRPMEQLQVQTRGSFALEATPSDELDSLYKPGLYRQTRAFLTGEGASDLPDIHHHLRRIQTIYDPMVAPDLLA